MGNLRFDRVIARTRRAALFGGAALVLMVAWGESACCAATINVGQHALRPNQPGQEVRIFVTGGEAVAGVNLFAQIGDGGPELSQIGLPAGEDGPAITAVDLKTGTIFAAVPGPQDNQAGLPQVAIASIEFTAAGAATPANGLLARLSIDTTGFTAGAWSLRLTDVLPQLAGGPFHSDFAGVPATIFNGSIVVTSTVIGDLDHDGTVGRGDLRSLVMHWGEIGPLTVDRGDLNADRRIGLADLHLLQQHLGASPSPVPVPEPATFVITVLSTALLLRTRAYAKLAHGSHATVAASPRT